MMEIPVPYFNLRNSIYKLFVSLSPFKREYHITYLGRSRSRALQISRELPVNLKVTNRRTSLDNGNIRTIIAVYQTYAFAGAKAHVQFALQFDNQEVCGMVVYREFRRFGFRCIEVMDIAGHNLPELIRRFRFTVRNRGVRFMINSRKFMTNLNS